MQVIREKKKTGAERLLEWMQVKRFFATHDVIRWGTENYYNRADRTKRNFVEQGLIRRLSQDEVIARGLNEKESYYEVPSYKAKQMTLL